MILREVRGKRGGFLCICKCDYCGREFSRQIADLKKHQFCKQECYWKWAKTARKGFKFSEETKEKMSKTAMKKNGGRSKDARGYILIYKPRHPLCQSSGYIVEHRLVMEEYLGRFLKSEEVVHHMNGVLNDNRIENLMLFPSGGKHTSYHRKLKREELCLSHLMKQR